MSFITNALGGNPFSTTVGSKIEQATDGTLASENWALNMEICDLVIETEDGPRDAIKAIRKRLQQSAGKNYTVVMYTLTVLETCVKNCGKPFHVLACSKDFVQELVKLIGPKNDPPTAVQEKVLSLIQSWADAFKNQPELSGVVQVYQDLLAKGIEFPPTDLDAMAPIHTPQRSVEEERPASSGTTSPPPPITSPTATNLTPEQRAKLQSELDVVQSNMTVLGELLSELKPGQEQPDALELLQELHVTCQSMQERLVDLISKLSNDEITAELLRINDDMNNLFLRYSRWENNREAGGQSASSILARSVPPPPVAAKASDSLIDLEGPDDVATQLSKLGVKETSAAAQLAKIDTVTAKNGPQGDEFDMFAQSRKVTYESSKIGGSAYKDNLEPDQISGGLSAATQNRQQNNPRDLEFDEMEAWLGTTSTGNEESVTSSEFDRFLAERAAAAENLPSVNQTGSTNTSTSKGKENKDSLFAL